MPFSTRTTVAFGDTDPAALVYYPNLFHYCHVAMERFFAECCGVPYHNLIANDRIGFPTVRIEAEFKRPFVYGDEIEISVDVLRVGGRSVTLGYSFSRLPDMLQSAHVTMVHVSMDLDSRTSIEIPLSLRNSLNELKA